MTFKNSLTLQSKSTESAQDIFNRAAERQETRKQQLKNYCLQHAGQRLPWENKGELNQFLFDDDNTFIYCAVPKAASTPMKMTLLSVRNNSKIKITSSSAHNPKYWKRLSGYSSMDLSNRQATYFKFLFVREPFHRLLSGYKDKFFGKNRIYTNGFRRMIVKTLRPQDEEMVSTDTNNVTFTEFLTFLISNSNYLTRDAHWMQVERICFPCAFHFDFIGHFETLEEDAAYFLNKAGLGERVTFPPVTSSSASSDFMKYYSQVPREVIYRLGEAFRADFEMFGYPFPGPLNSLLSNYTA